MTGSRATSDLLVRFSAPGQRVAAAAALADRLGVEEVLLFVRDPALGTLIPAPGFPQTVRGGRAWRDFLARCAEPGRTSGEVDLPLGACRPALALVVGGMAAVLLGGRVVEGELERVERLLPLLAATLAVEQELVVAKTEVAAAEEAASRAQALAAALEAARAEGFRLNVQLREEHRRKDDFLAMLAHELRNPLAPLASTIEVLRRRGSAPGLVDSHLDVMTRQVGQLSRLVEDLLDVARVSHGQIELRRQDLKVREALADAIEASRPLLDSRGHRIELSLPDRPLWVSADRARLTQVFANLLHNAGKYTDHGGRIEVAVAREGEAAVVRVRDDGVGIAADTIPHIFDLFTQAPRSRDRAQGGLGIGLTLVRSIVELHGGEVTVESEGLGKGSTFTVRLPLGVPAPVTAAGPAAKEGSTDEPGRPLRVLVVDDNQDAADSLADVLRILGHQVEVAYGGLTALQLAADFDADLVLLDIGLPDLEGYEVARRLRRLAAPDTRLVALTGYGSAEDKRLSRNAGFDEHVTKPVMPETLRDILARAAAHRDRAEAYDTQG